MFIVTFKQKDVRTNKWSTVSTEELLSPGVVGGFILNNFRWMKPGEVVNFTIVCKEVEDELSV